MGRFVDYNGNMDVPKEKRTEFTENMMKLLRYGGMVQFDKFSLFGREISLLRPIELNGEGKAYFHYNYFEDNSWDRAYYDANDIFLYAGKVGGLEFCDVIVAAYHLFELNDEEVGYVLLDGSCATSSMYVGWINQLLGTNYSMKKRFRLWDNFEKYCMEREEREKDLGDVGDVVMLIPQTMRWAMGGVEFADICYIINGTGTLREEEIVPNTYAEVVYKCKKILTDYYAGDKVLRLSRKNMLWELLRQEQSYREEVKDDILCNIAKMTLEIPARVFVYLTAEILQLDFWYEWKQMRKCVYMDERIAEYATSVLREERKREINKPIKGIRTSDFLLNDDYFIFRDTPAELKGVPNYCISDDDRAFWWDGTDEVILSEEMDAWLQGLTKQHLEIRESLELVDNNLEKNMERLIIVLTDIADYFCRIFAFQSMFFEFVQHADDGNYLAAIILLERLAEKYKDQGKIIKKVDNWGMANRNVTHNIARIKLKRYLAVMANKKLRYIYFGF